MKHSLLAASAALGLLLGAPSLRAEESLLGGLSIGVDALFMTVHRDKDALAIDDSNGKVVLDGREVGDDWAPGIRATVGLPLGPASALEARGFYLFSLEETSSIFNDSENLEWAFTEEVNPGNDLDDINSAEDTFGGEVDLHTSVWGLELNYREHLWNVYGVDVGWLAGARYIRFKDELGLVTYDEENDLPGGGDDDRVIGALDVTNNLFGGQVGLSLGGPLLIDGLTLGADLRAGLYANASSRDRLVDDLDEANDADSFLSDDESTTAFAQGFEINVGLAYEVFPGVAVQAGYQMLMLNNIGTSTGEFEGLADLDADYRPNESVLLHGGYAGIKVAF